MKNSSKLLALLIAVIFVLTTFVGCVQTTPAGTDDTTTGEDTTTEVTEVTEATGVDLELSKEDLSRYVIIYGTKADASVKSAANALRDELNAAFETDIEAKIDWVKDPSAIPESAKEIVIGSTNRPGITDFEKNLRNKDYVIVCSNDRIFILGGSPAATIEAIKCFKEKHLDLENKLVKINTMLEYTCLFNYPAKSVTINGVDIRDYTVIIPKEADLSEKYAADNMVAYFFEYYGYDLTVSSDVVAETEYEILIGDTNREESSVSLTTDPSKCEYILFKSGSKIVCQGESYMVGGGVGELAGRIPLDQTNVDVKIDDLSSEPAVKTFTFKEAKSAILMIGDGMGFNSIKMSLPSLENNLFIAQDLPNQGNAYTGSLDTASNSSTPTDSAASGTALATGVKTKNGYVGRDKDNKDLLNIRELADSKGYMTGVISTDYITGATPSAFLAHHYNRNNTTALGNQINNLIKDGKVDWCAGDVGNNLTTNTADALKLLSANNSSFFLMVEEGHIDKRSHDNDKSGCINMVKRFNDDIAYVIQFVLCHPDTVLIITADHETGGITKMSDGSFKYTTGNHSTANVPICAIGYGTEIFNGKESDNTAIPKFIAKIYGENNFGS
ncbi:MAG: alkaline phosphatase [Clostridia bacterium]|nr:alkaline phosphatase [Clostridia bacterium]